MGSISPIIYLIRHGEKDPKLADGEDPIGLSSLGNNRAQGLVQVFGKDSKYDIGLIVAQKYKKSGKRRRPYDTIKPLADSLGLVPDTSIDRDDSQALADLLRSHRGPGNILVCWEHKELENLAKAIGVLNAQSYPGERFDVIWTLKDPYDTIHSVTSEHVPGLDDKYIDFP